MDDDDAAPYKVWVFFPDESSYCVGDGLGALEACEMAKRQTETVGARLGISRRIIIEDSLGYTAFEWRYGKGITFPKPQISATTGESDGQSAEESPPA